jgi:hypothetical protein
MEKHKLPYALSSLLCGIISVFVSVLSVLSIILGFLGLNYYNKAMNIYNSNPDMYYGLNKAKIGKLLSSVSIMLGTISTIYYIYLYTLKS